jgi:hypothetical protein
VTKHGSPIVAKCTTNIGTAVLEFPEPLNPRHRYRLCVRAKHRYRFRGEKEHTVYFSPRR